MIVIKNKLHIVNDVLCLCNILDFIVTVVGLGGG